MKIWTDGKPYDVFEPLWEALGPNLPFIDQNFAKFLFFSKKIKKNQVLLEQNFFIKLTEQYVESILKLICKDRIKNESRISERRFLTCSLFRPDGRELVNCKN